MSRWERCTAKASWLAAGTLVILAAAVPLHGEESPADIRRLLGRLGHPEFHIRQEATEALLRVGDDVLPHVAGMVRSPDAEVRSRALAILSERALSSSVSTRDRARQALRELAASPDARVRVLASAALEQVRETVAGLAVGELSELGATLMPVYGGPPLTFNVQIGQGWKGTSDRLALLADLGHVPWLSFESSSIDDDALCVIAGLAAVGGGPTRLFLGNSRVRGDRLRDLAPLTRLEYLSFKQLAITDAQLATLPDFPQLEYLGLDGTRITDDGLQSLARFKRLQVLWLDGTQISDAGLVHLAGLDALRTLYLPETQVRGAGLAALRKLPNLASLSLKGNRLTPDCLKNIARLEQLESLGLDRSDVTDWQLADLTPLARLRVLWLTGTEVSDAALVHLKQLGGLQILHVGDTNVTKQGAAALQQALPRCQVTMSSLPRTVPAAPNNAPRPAPRGAGR